MDFCKEDLQFASGEYRRGKPKAHGDLRTRTPTAGPLLRYPQARMPDVVSPSGGAGVQHSPQRGPGRVKSGRRMLGLYTVSLASRESTRHRSPWRRENRLGSSPSRSSFGDFRPPLSAFGWGSAAGTSGLTRFGSVGNHPCPPSAKSCELNRPGHVGSRPRPGLHRPLDRSPYTFPRGNYFSLIWYPPRRPRPRIDSSSPLLSSLLHIFISPAAHEALLPGEISRSSLFLLYTLLRHPNRPALGKKRPAVTFLPGQFLSGISLQHFLSLSPSGVSNTNPNPA